MKESNIITQLIKRNAKIFIYSLIFMFLIYRRDLKKALKYIYKKIKKLLQFLFTNNSDRKDNNII
jgi:hypothetical protein